MLTNEQPESDHLDYKDQRALDVINQKPKPPAPGLQKAQNDAITELTRDVSAFANSDGGMLIYGISEDEQTHLPTAINVGFPNNGKVSKEWLGDLIDSRISPRISGIRIIPIKRSDTHSLFVIDVPKSSRAPHQADDGVHYRRYNFSNRRMQSYELKEVFQARRLESPRLLAVSLSTESIFVRIEVKNLGQEPARDVSFQVSPGLARWLEKKPRSLLKLGAKVISPGTKYVFHGDTAPNILSGNTLFPKTFNIEASYFTPISQERISELFEFDIGDLEGSGVIESDMDRLVNQLRDSTNTIQAEVKSIRRAIETANAQSIGRRISQFIDKGIKKRHDTHGPR